MKDTATIPYKIYLSEDELPRNWYNVRADIHSCRGSRLLKR